GKVWEALRFILGTVFPATFGRMTRKVRYSGDEVAGKMLAGKEGAAAAKGAGQQVSKAGGGWSYKFLWFLHIVLVIAVLVGLFYIGWKSGLGRVVHIDPLYVRFYLPALALLVYGLIWLGWYLSRLLAAEEEETPYPDIDTAWEEAIGALEQGGIDLKSAPLFLVLGKPAGTE